MLICTVRRSLATCSAAILLIATSTIAQEKEQATAEFVLVHSFSLPNLPESEFKSELFRKVGKEATLPDIVDLNVQFSNEHGKATMLAPQFSLQTHTMILRFADGWTTTNMVRADGKSRFICRFKFKLVEPKPPQADFGKYVEWCQGMLTISALDPSFAPPP